MPDPEKRNPSPRLRGEGQGGGSEPRDRTLIRHARDMRKEATGAEALLWSQLRAKQLGVRFRRQHPIGGYIVDFYCAQAKLCIELDGGGHAEAQQVEYDRRRDARLEELGLRVLRLWNPEVVRRLDEVLELIWECVHGAEVLPPRGEVDV